MTNSHNNMVSHKFAAEERLKSNKQIEMLFRSGKAFFVDKLKVIYLLTPSQENDKYPIKVGFSIPKKKFKSAVKRNLIRRRFKESWRLQKQVLSSRIPTGKQLHCFLIYTQNTILNFEQATLSIKQAIKQLSAIAQDNT